MREEYLIRFQFRAAGKELSRATNLEAALVSKDPRPDAGRSSSEPWTAQHTTQIKVMVRCMDTLHPSSSWVEDKRKIKRVQICVQRHFICLPAIRNAFTFHKLWDHQDRFIG
eukprot:gene10663-7408_t